MHSWCHDHWGKRLCTGGQTAHIQHLGCVDCDSFRRPSPRQLPKDNLSKAAGYSAAEAAVRAAFPVGVLDPARLRQAGAPYLLDPMRACPGPGFVCLAQVVVWAAYIELVGAYFCAHTADHVRLVALHLPVASCMRRFIPDLARPATVQAPVPSVVPSALAPADCEDEPWLCADHDPRPTPPPSFPALALPSPACSSDDASMGTCPRLRAPVAVAICSVPLAHALVSSDDEVWPRITPRGSRFRVSPPPINRPALRGAGADGET